jgi:hypothetical protein
MESFDAYRKEAVKNIAQIFDQLSRRGFLDMLARFRNLDDRKHSLRDLPDSGMYT